MQNQSKYLLFSDPHLGKNLSANTTSSSREALKNNLLMAARGAIQSGRALNIYPLSVCLGDLFDSFSNSEKIILQGASVASNCYIVLAGNHDTSNNKEAVSSLDIVDSLAPGSILSHKYGNTGVLTRGPFAVIPHVATTALFEAALDAAETLKEKPPYLLLHCNYDSGFAEADISLNLTQVRAKRLIESGYKRIFIGHEHSYAEHMGGKVIVLGNTYPTGFSDISDKWAVVLDVEDDTIERNLIWSKEENYLEITVPLAGGYDNVTLIDHEFIRVSGKVEPGELGQYAAWVRKVWKTNPYLIALKSDVTITQSKGQVVTETSEYRTVTEQITAELEHSPELLAVWKEVAPSHSVGVE